ncbi:MAG: replication protein DnaC [Oscillospiraceae bacterium]|nr:replication protein DnaC [Oscillospiraceae bacterium]
MSYDATVIRRASARLESRRRQRERELAARREELYRKLPRLAELDGALRKTLVRIARAALSSQGNPEGHLNAIRAENGRLQSERAQLLEQAGYPPDILDDKPDCLRCGDTGRKNGELCGCLKKLCAEEQIRELSKLLDLGEQSFERFSLEWYPDAYDPAIGKSPRQNMKLVSDFCREYARRFGSFPFANLFLTGSTGLGKTFLSACIARMVSEQGYSVVYDTAGNIFSAFESQKFARDTEAARDARDETHRYLNCDLLILDDLGAELTTPFVQSALYQLVNSRLLAGKRTVISSNLSMDEVRKKYTPQIASRLEGEYRVLPFFGQDIRLLRRPG